MRLVRGKLDDASSRCRSSVTLNTQENRQGRLPDLVAESGLKNVSEQGNYNTVFGTLRLLAAKKQAFGMITSEFQG